MNTILSVGKFITKRSVALHSHDNWELICCTNGEGVLKTDAGAAMPYSKRDIIAVAPRTSHINETSVGFANIYINFDSLMLPAKPLIKITDSRSRLIYNCMSQAHYFFVSDEPAKTATLGHLGQIIGESVVSFINEKRYSDGVNALYMDIIKNYTDETYSAGNALQISGFQGELLRKRFKEEVGATPLQFLTDCRLTFSKRLLSERSGNNISEISSLSGFSDPLYFSRLFKQHTGMSPRDYKNTFR